MAQFATFSASQLATLKLARLHAPKAQRQAIKKDVFAAIKCQYGLPKDMILKVGLESGHVKTKAGDLFPLAADGKWINAERATPALVWAQVNLAAVGKILADPDNAFVDLSDLVRDGAAKKANYDQVATAVGQVATVTDADTGEVSLMVALAADDADDLGLND